MIILPAHAACFTHNFVSGMQSFGIADLSCKIVFWTHKFAVGLIDNGNSKSTTLKQKIVKKI